MKAVGLRFLAYLLGGAALGALLWAGLMSWLGMGEMADHWRRLVGWAALSGLCLPALGVAIWLLKRAAPGKRPGIPVSTQGGRLAMESGTSVASPIR